MHKTVTTNERLMYLGSDGSHCLNSTVAQPFTQPKTQETI